MGNRPQPALDRARRRLRVANLAFVTREEILRGDFPAERKGYDRAAVDAHLRRLADEMERLQARAGAAGGSLAETAGGQVAGIIAAAEEKAAELEEEARIHAEGIVAEARQKAEEQVRLAQDSVAGLVSQADELRDGMGELSGGIAVGPGAETPPMPGPVRVPEPEPPAPEVD